jgi:hypothetical protein
MRLSRGAWTGIVGGVLVALAAGTALGLSLGGGDGSPSRAEIAEGVRHALASTSTSTTPVTTTTTVAPTTAPPTTSPPTLPPEPRGSVSYVPTYQGASSAPNCSVWTMRMVNNSNTEVVRFTWDPLPAKYVDGGDPGEPSYREWPAEPATSSGTSVSLPPYQSQDVRFENCTSTPVPEGQFTSLKIDGGLVGTHFTWQWSTGQAGTGCYGGPYNLGC